MERLSPFSALDSNTRIHAKRIGRIRLVQPIERPGGLDRVAGVGFVPVMAISLAKTHSHVARFPRSVRETEDRSAPPVRKRLISRAS